MQESVVKQLTKQEAGILVYNNTKHVINNMPKDT